MSKDFGRPEGIAGDLIISVNTWMSLPAVDQERALASLRVRERARLRRFSETIQAASRRATRR